MNNKISPLGRQLLKAQEKCRLNQSEMAQVLGMSQPWYNQVLHGAKRVYDFQTLQKIAEVAEVDLQIIAKLAGKTKPQKAKAKHGSDDEHTPGI